jgi:hypothetical protein
MPGPGPTSSTPLANDADTTGTAHPVDTAKRVNPCRDDGVIMGRFSDPDAGVENVTV